MTLALGPCARDQGALDRVRVAGERAAAGTASGVRLHSVEPVPPGQGEPRGPRALIRVTLGVLDDRLAPSMQVVEVRSGRELAGLIRLVAPSNRARMRMAARLATANAVAIVETVTAAALAHCGTTPEVAANRLVGGEDIVRLAFGPGRELKAWLADGRLRCSFEPDDRVRWSGSRLVVRQRVPAAYGIALTGRPLSAIIEHPALPGSLRIIRAEPAGDDVEIAVRQRTRPVRPSAPGNV